MNTGGNLMRVRQLKRTFRVSRGLFTRTSYLQALRGVSFDLNKGDILGIVGESGCGKSTLARLLLGLDSPTGGEVRLEGKPIANLRTSVLSRKIQPIFQDPYSSLNPRKSVASIIELPLRVHQIGDPASRRRAVREIMDSVGLPPRLADSYPSQISGGQRQRVAIARALVMKPEIINCDEPTSALDVSVQAQILNVLLDLKDRYGLTYIFISHNLAVVESIATRVAVMYLGRVVEQADRRAFFANPRHPYSKALLASVLTPDPDLGVPEPELGIAFPSPLDVPAGCAFNPRCVKSMAICRQRDPLPIGTAEDFVECHLYANTTDGGWVRENEE